MVFPECVSYFIPEKVVDGFNEQNIYVYQHGICIAGDDTGFPESHTVVQEVVLTFTMGWCGYGFNTQSCSLVDQLLVDSITVNNMSSTWVLLFHGVYVWQQKWTVS